MVFSPDGHRLATASADATVRLWDADTGQPLGAPLTGHTDAVWSVVFSPDGHRLASTGGDNGAAVGRRHRAARAPARVTRWGPGGGVRPGRAPPGHGSYDSTVRLWDAETGRPLGDPLTGHTGGERVAFSPDGHRLATAAGQHGAAVGRRRRPTAGDPLTGHKPGVQRGVQPDGHRLASASDDTTVRLWDTDTGHPSATRSTATPAWFAVWRSPPTAGGQRPSDGTVRIWDVSTGGPLGVPHGHTDVVTGVAFSPDGRLLASSGGDGPVRMWGAVSGGPRRTLQGHCGGI